jgi:hypothetical protein
MWDPQRLTTLWAFTACYRNSFTFYIGCNPYDPVDFLQMSDITNGVESAVYGSPVAGVEYNHQILPPDIKGPTAVNGDLHGGPKKISVHPTDSRATQVSFHGSNTTSLSDSFIVGGSQRHNTDQSALRPLRARPTSFPESLISCR